MKILYLILGTKQDPWVSIESWQRKTWIKDTNKNDVVRYIYGDGSLGDSSKDPTFFHNTKLESPFDPYTYKAPVQVCKDSWVFESVSGWGELITNTISAMKYAVENIEFDFLIRTNVSSYWNPIGVRKLLRTLPSTNVYAGKKWTLYNDPTIEYVAGYGIIMSKDVVLNISKNSHFVDPRIIDDVSIALALKQLEIEILDLDQPIIENLKDLKNFGKLHLHRFHAFRCKSEVLSRTDNIIRNDYLLFQKIRRRIKFRWLYVFHSSFLLSKDLIIARLRNHLSK
jgi:hypothetical protein